MWRAEGYTEVASFAHRFAFRRGMNRSTQEKLLEDMKRRQARREARKRDARSWRDQDVPPPKPEDASNVQDADVLDGAFRAGPKALYFFLADTPLFLVGPNEVVPVSDAILKSHHNIHDVTDYLLSPALLTHQHFSVSANEVVEIADAAKLLKSRASRFLSLQGNLDLDNLLSLGSLASAFRAYEGYVLSVKKGDVPTTEHIEQLLGLRGNQPNATPDSLMDALRDFDVCFPSGKGASAWHEVEKRTGYSRRQLVRAFKKFGRRNDGQRVG